MKHSRFITSLIMPAFAAIALFATAGPAVAAVTSVKKMTFTSIVAINKTSAPERVLFSGEVDVAAQLATPSASCTPDSPCRVTGAIAVVAPGISGVGLTGGLKFLIIGVNAVKRTLAVPGSTVV